MKIWVIEWVPKAESGLKSQIVSANQPSQSATVPHKHGFGVSDVDISGPDASMCKVDFLFFDLYWYPIFKLNNIL